MDEWYQMLEKMTPAEHTQMQKIGNPVMRAALREVARRKDERFGPVKQRFLDGDLSTISSVLSIVETANPGRFDAFAYCDGCHKFMLHEHEGPANAELGIAGHWPTFLARDIST